MNTNIQESVPLCLVFSDLQAAPCPEAHADVPLPREEPALAAATAAGPGLREAQCCSARMQEGQGEGTLQLFPCCDDWSRGLSHPRDILVPLNLVGGLLRWRTALHAPCRSLRRNPAALCFAVLSPSRRGPQPTSQKEKRREEKSSCTLLEVAAAVTGVGFRRLIINAEVVVWPFLTRLVCAPTVCVCNENSEEK